MYCPLPLEFEWAISVLAPPIFGVLTFAIFAVLLIGEVIFGCPIATADGYFSPLKQKRRRALCFEVSNETHKGCVVPPGMQVGFWCWHKGPGHLWQRKASGLSPCVAREACGHRFPTGLGTCGRGLPAALCGLLGWQGPSTFAMLMHTFPVAQMPFSHLSFPGLLSHL